MKDLGKIRNQKHKVPHTGGGGGVLKTGVNGNEVSRIPSVFEPSGSAHPPRETQYHRAGPVHDGRQDLP